MSHLMSNIGCSEHQNPLFYSKELFGTLTALHLLVYNPKTKTCNVIIVYVCDIYKTVELQTIINQFQRFWWVNSAETQNIQMKQNNI